MEHLSEQTDEVDWVAGLFPEARDYLDTYEVHGLLGPGALFGHAIYLSDRERARLREVDAALIHCPTSNTFIGSGLFDDDTFEVGVGISSRGFTGFGTAWIDYDGDGLLDLVIVNGAVRVDEVLAASGDPLPLRQSPSDARRRVGGAIHPRSRMPLKLS